MKEHIVNLYGAGNVYMIAPEANGESNDYVFIDDFNRLTEIVDGREYRISGRIGTYIKKDINEFVGMTSYAYKNVDNGDYKFTFKIELEDGEEFKQTKLRLIKLSGWTGEVINGRTLVYNGREYWCEDDDMSMPYDEDGEWLSL